MDTYILWIKEWFVKNRSCHFNTLNESVNYFEFNYIDSLSIFSLVLDIEQEFNITFNESDFQDGKLSTINELAEFINKHAI